MQQCPNCKAAAPAEARFCPECGARFDDNPAVPQDQPTRPGGVAGSAGKETVVLRASEIAPTMHLSPGDSAPTSAGLNTITGAAAPIMPTSPTAPPTSGSAPTAAFPAPSSNMDAPAYVPAYTPLAQPAPQSSGRRIWLVLGLIAGLGLIAVVVLILGVVLIFRDRLLASGSVPLTQPTALATTAARPTTAVRPTTAPSFTAVPRPTVAIAAGVGTTLLRDTFDAPDRSSLTEDSTNNATYTFVDGAYQIALKTPKYIVWSPFDGTYDNASVEVDAKLDKGPRQSAAGLIFRYQDDDNFYMFNVTGDGYYDLDMYKDGTLTTLIDWTESAEIKPSGEINHLRVETTDARIRLFVNDKLLDEVSDDTFTKGKMALSVNTFDEGGATVLFDNLVVRGSK